jgi:hypothetical protein
MFIDLSISSIGFMPSCFAQTRQSPSGSALEFIGFDIKTTAGLFLHLEHSFIFLLPWKIILYLNKYICDITEQIRIGNIIIGEYKKYYSEAPIYKDVNDKYKFSKLFKFINIRKD